LKPVERVDDHVVHYEDGAFLTGTQAIVRMLLAQRRMDQLQGLHTAGFVSGYRGSPLSGLDQELWRHQASLEEAAIRFLPAINEDLAATAILGTQRIGTDPDALYEGVFSLWYGKGPGVDRSGDALKHGNAYGSSPKGGVLVVAGDDHGCVSSSMPHQSDQAFIAWSMPVLNPASIAEYIEFGLYGWALSRFSGNWVGFKAIAETIESAASVPSISISSFKSPIGHAYPPEGVHYRWPDFPSVAIEERLSEKLDAVAAFSRINSIDRHIVTSSQARIGIITCGKAHFDLMEALRYLGLHQEKLKASGIRIYKIGLSYPIERTRLMQFVDGLQDVLVVEEKGPVVEQQVKSLLYNQPAVVRPVVVGKTDEFGHAFIPSSGQLSPSLLLPLVARWLGRHFPKERFAARMAASAQPGMQEVIGPALAKRSPYYCSGCPHNTSTIVPEGSRAQAGIGCHFMAAWMDRKTTGLTQMGGEGADWVGQSLFTRTPHVFQNLGDGTYFHSGYLALRQAVAARANITYKILYNDAVAMTGGQPIDGKLSVSQIANQVTDEGVQKVVIVAEDISRYALITDLPANVRVHDRSELDAVQRQLRDIRGVTVLIYDQMCAAEKRRQSKRGLIADSQRHVVINAAVCEGCGDCGKHSNCLAILPLETEFGRKRVIDQFSCNKDLSCMEGLCPSFVSVVGGTLRKTNHPKLQTETLRAMLQRYPEPIIAAVTGHYNILIAGIGGTGVVTAGSVIAQAAHMEGKGASMLNFKGFAQKGGAVLNHIRLAVDSSGLAQVRIDREQADAMLICDLVVGASDDALRTVRHGHTMVFASQSEIATGQFTRDPDADIDAPQLIGRMRQAAGAQQVSLFDAQHYARLAFGDTIVANMIIAGYAWQRGGIPVGMQFIDKAIDQTGVAVDMNRKAFMLGRLIAADETAVRSLLGQNTSVIQFVKKPSLENTIRTRIEFLCRYQNADYAELYSRQVAMIEVLEKSMLSKGAPLKLTETVAKCLFKLMAYKDEYEVARLFSDGHFERQLHQQFEGKFTLQFHMAPAWLFSGNPGRPTKLSFGPWMKFGLKLLARFKFLRGSAFDLFGYRSERRAERRLINEYIDMLKKFATQLSPENLDTAIALAALPEMIRGYGQIKSAAIEKTNRQRADLLQQFDMESRSHQQEFAGFFRLSAR